MNKIILISAKAQNGKDTCSDYLKNKLESNGSKVAVMHYAYYLKDILIRFYGWDGKCKSEYWRSMFQYLGTDKIRNKMKKPLFHVNRVCEDIQIIEDDFDYVIIPDTRFINEIHYPKALFPDKVVEVRVIRDNFVSPLTMEQLSHISETGLDNYKFSNIVYNSGTIQDFYNNIDKKLGWLYE